MKTSQGKATFYMFVGQLSVALANLPVTIILAHRLQPSGLGEYQYLSRLALLSISLAHLGLPHALTWAAAHATTREQVSAVYRLAVRVPLVTGSSTFVFWLAARAFGLAEEVATITWICFGLVPVVNMIAANMASCFRGTLEIRAMMLIRISQAVTSLVGIAILAASGRLDLQTAAIANLGSQMIGAGFALALSRRRSDAAAWDAELPKSAIWAFSRRVWLGLTLRDWNLFLDQVVVKLTLGAHQLGLYAAAVSLSMALTVLIAPISAAVQPLVQAVQGTAHEQQICARALVGASLLLALPATGLAALAPILLPTLYGDSFSAAIPALQILCLATAVEAYNFCMHGILLGLGRPGLSSLSSAAGLTMSVAGWFVLIPPFGIVGAAWASVLAYSTVNILMTRSLTRALGCPPLSLARECAKYLRHPLRLVREENSGAATPASDQ
jgi:O-antigen/teichoic acid export membrane protein